MNNSHCNANNVRVFLDTTYSNHENEIDVIVDEMGPPEATATTVKEIKIQFCNKDFVIDVSNKRNKCVVNLSTRVLSEIEMNVLEKGLKFCPTPGEPDLYNIQKDLRDFFRRMRLRAFFHDNETTPTPSQSNLITNYISQTEVNESQIDLRKFKPKSTWEPNPQYRDPVLETFFKSVQNEVSRFTPREPRNKNITQDEKAALKALENDPNYSD